MEYHSVWWPPTEQEKEAEKLTRQDEDRQPDQMEEVDAGDAAYGAGNEGAAEEAGPLQVRPACILLYRRAIKRASAKLKSTQ